tara:strand:- start:446 stop:1402 length:957 start_codon:yes stop_codon:yes gene_type:complete
MKKKILVITPISHINGLEELLKKHFILTKLDDPNKKQVLKIVHKYDVIFTNPNMSKVFISKEIMNKGKKLSSICTASTGTNHIDLKFAKKNNVKVISLRNNKNIINKISSTAEHALSLMLAKIRKIPESNQSVKNNIWDYRPFIGRQLNNMKIGIVGYGRLGKMLVKYLLPLAGKIFIYEKQFTIKNVNKKIKQVSLKKLLMESDAISLHIHADKINIDFINKKTLNLMKNNVLIVNTSRGEIINETDLVSFLRKNKKAQYATDVLKGEILDKFNSKVLQYSRNSNQILITPHIGGMTKDAQELAYLGVAKKLILNNL